MDNTNEGLVQWVQDLFNNLLSGTSYRNDRATAPSAFAEQVSSLFPPHINILEIGCGFGHDAAYFADKENSVTALDNSHVVIERAKRLYRSRNNISFQTFDISTPLPFTSETFDAIYAHFSLQYFTESQTHFIFSQLTHVLKPFGLLCFACRSTNDFEYGRGRQIEKDVFIRNKRVRHFFTTGYAAYCLGNTYKVISNREVKETIQSRSFSEVSAIQVIAKKR